MTKFNTKQWIWKILFGIFSVWTYFYPIAALVLPIFRYEALITVPTAYLCIDLGLLSAVLVCFFIQKPQAEKVEQIVAAFCVPSVAATCLSLAWHGINLLCGCIGILLFLGSAALAYSLCRKHSALTALVPVGLGILFLICFAITAFFGNFSSSTVVRAEYSPDNRYIAEVIDSDQGALGGATLVTVRENKELRLPTLAIQKKASCLYTGRYGEFEDMILSWQTNDTLRIWDRVYTVSKSAFDTDTGE